MLVLHIILSMQRKILAVNGSARRRIEDETQSKNIYINSLYKCNPFELIV